MVTVLTLPESVGHNKNSIIRSTISSFVPLSFKQSGPQNCVVRQLLLNLDTNPQLPIVH